MQLSDALLPDAFGTGWRTNFVVSVWEPIASVRLAATVTANLLTAGPIGLAVPPII